MRLPRISACLRRREPHIHLTLGPCGARRHLAIGIRLDRQRQFLNHTPLLAYLRGDFTRPPFENTDLYWQVGPVWVTTSEG